MSHYQHHRTRSITQREEEQSLLDPSLSQNADQAHSRKHQQKVKLARALALLCACSLSVGSHYATYILGPLKSRLSREMGTSNTEFGLLLAALSLSGTWTPLVGGVLTARLGTTVSSIIATGTVFLGQALLLLGHLNNDVQLMTLGMFIFGLGHSPLAVAQETIIVRFFKSHGLGVSLALGLVAGKGASFVSARTSYPLSQWSPNAPFYVSAVATGFSFVINLVYIFISRWLIKESGEELSAEAKRRSVVGMSEAQVIQQVADKRRFRMREVFKLGDVVWAYIGLNVLCGMIWHPFIHLAPNIFERRFGLSEVEAGSSAAYLLSGSIFLYPLCGTIVDRVKRGSIVVQLMAVASAFTLLAFFWMVMPPTLTITPWPAIVCFGTAMGFAPLLLVVIVPRIVSLDYVSTTLGLHKSLENTGVTITQTLSGLWLDSNAKKGKIESFLYERHLQWLLNGFFFVNLLHLGAIQGIGYLYEKKQNNASKHEAVQQNEGDDEGEDTPDPNEASSSSTLDLATWDRTEDHIASPLLHPRHASPIGQRYGTHLLRRRSRSPHDSTTPTAAEVRRGKVFATMSATTVVFAWVLFLVTSFVKLRSKREREGYST